MYVVQCENCWGHGVKLFCIKLPFNWPDIIFINEIIFRVASRPGIPGNLEKSGNLVALEKSQGNVREFREIRKNQGILTRNWEKSGNYTCAKRISTKFFQDSLKW